MGVTVCGFRVAASWATAVWLLFEPAVAGEACANFAQAKDHLYSVYIGMVAEDVRAIPHADDDKTLRTGLEELAKSYAAKTQFGDIVYLKKLIGIGLFTAYGSNQEPPDGTTRLTCNLARTSPQVLEALTCAAIALDGARRSNPNSNELVRRMVTLAREKIESDRDPNAQKLVDEVAPVLLGCVSN